MKQILLLLSVIFTVSLSAQTLQSVNADIEMPVNPTAMDGANSLFKAAVCGVDTNGYALAKATGLEALNINNATSAGATAQYFDAPQSLTISGVSFYAWKPDMVNGITMNATVEIYAAALDSTPTGVPLATTTVVVDTVFGGGTLSILRKHGTFATPVTVTSAYVVVVSNLTATPMSMVFNSWTAADGGQEWLSSVLIGANWLRSYGVNIGGTTFDADCLFEPHISYNLNAGFTVDDPCNIAGAVSTFTNTSSPITNNRMYNVAAYQSIPEVSYTWDYGDASPTENFVDVTHTYASVGSYMLTLTDTIFGWTTNCSTDTIVPITVVAASVASYTEVISGSMVTFTNTSVSGTGSTYLWDFGDGNTSTQMSPIHTYLVDGTYTVCLTVTDACGSVQTCNTVTVGCPVPVSGYTFSVAGSTADFTNTSTTGTGATYLWDFGDGNSATTMNASNIYSADGTYLVCLTVSDACGSDSTCQTIVVTTCAAPVAGFTSSETGAGVFDFTNTSTSTGTATYAWDFGDGNTSGLMSPSNTYASGGTYTVVLVVTDSCGSNTFTSTVSTTVGLSELSLIDVAVYPNPSNGMFKIEASAEMMTAYITDLSGKLVYSKELTGNKATINAAQFANGTYFLSIHFADGMNQMVRLEVMK